MKSNNDELITQIKERLAEHEEAYVPGAWERFNEPQKTGRGRVFWLWGLSSAAAAVVVIGATLFLFKGTNQVQVPAPVQVTITGQRPDPALPVKNKIAQGIALNNSSKENKRTFKNKEGIRRLDYIPGKTKNMVLNQVAAEKQLIVSSVVAVSPVVAHDKSDTAVLATLTETHRKATFEEFLSNEALVNAESKAPKVPVKDKDKWELGVVVAPSFGNTKKLNMGYGVSMGYALSERISLNSGISYNEMAASRNIDAPVNMSLAGKGKSLESTDAKLVGIDIPLEIKYNLSKSIYANVGVSAFAVLDQQRNNSYIEGKLVERAVASPAGYQELKTFVVNERVTEPVPESEIEDSRYLGFYNVSFGYRQKISKDKAVSIEPFLKIPMKDATKDNLKLMGTGVKLKFNF